METLFSHFVLVCVQKCEKTKNKKHSFLRITKFPFVIFITIVDIPSINTYVLYKQQKNTELITLLRGKR